MRRSAEVLEYCERIGSDDCDDVISLRMLEEIRGDIRRPERRNSRTGVEVAEEEGEVRVPAGAAGTAAGESVTRGFETFERSG